jgi:subtilisin family serine protease
MAAPLVSGTVALMLEANPALTPNLVKAILHYTAERRPRAELAAQGAGLLNARGAVQFAVALARGDAGPPDPARWARHIIWGNARVTGGVITADANAWRLGVTWGAATAPDGSEIAWGRTTDDDAVWGTQGSAQDLVSADGAAAPVWSDVPIDLAWASTTSPSAPQHGSLPAALFDRRWLWLLTVR